MDRTRFADLARSLAAHRTRRQAVRSAGALALAGALGRLATPEAARAAIRRTARCPLGKQGADNTNFEATDSTHAQTFKPKMTGKLKRVKLVVDDNPSQTTGDDVVRIHPRDASDTPDLTTVLAETTVPSAGLSAGQTTITATFAGSTAPKLKATTQYAVAVSLTNSSRWFLVHRVHNEQDSCPTSHLWFTLGSAFVTSEAYDLVFAVFVAA